VASLGPSLIGVLPIPTTEMALLYARMWSFIHLLTFFFLYSVGSSDTLKGLERCGGERCIPRSFGSRHSGLGAANEIGATINVNSSAEPVDSLENRRVPDDRPPRYFTQSELDLLLSAARAIQPYLQQHDMVFFVGNSGG